MAYIVPPTFTPGAILTAAQMTILGNDILAGGPIYATEAARDAAIPSPFEGQRAYITGTTVVTAGGLVIAVPTGIQYIHNGSSTPSYAANWVCVTPVSASNTANGTLGVSGYTGTLLGTPGTNVSCTVPTGTTALISISSGIYNSSSNAAYMSVAVSGATTLAASDNYALNTALPNALIWGMTFTIGGLTAGTNTFTLNYKSVAVTSNFYNRYLTVQGIA